MSNILLRHIQAYGEIIISGCVEFHSTKTISLTDNPSEIGVGATNYAGDLFTLGRSFYAPMSKAPPSMNERSAGSRIVLEPAISNATTDYAIGLETDSMWFSSNGGFKFYHKSTEALSFNNQSANLTLSSGATFTLGDKLTLRNTDSTGVSAIDFKNSNGDSRLQFGFGNPANASGFANDAFLVTDSNFAINTDTLYVKKSTGDIGIGITAPLYKLHVSGSLGVSSTATFLSTSDASSSVNSGAVQISGGISVSKSLWVSNGVNITGPNNTGTLSIRGDSSANDVLRIQNSASSSASKLFLINNGASSGTSLRVYQSDEQYVSLESSGNDKFTLKTVNSAGSGSIPKSLVLEASSNSSGGTNANQLLLQTDGNVSIANNLVVSGSITSGTWSGETIGVAKGGTGQTLFSQGQIVYGDGTNPLATSSDLTWSSGTNTLNTANLSVTDDAVVASKLGIGLDPSNQSQRLQVQGEVLLNLMSGIDSGGKITLGRQDFIAREHSIEVFNSATDAASNYMRFNVHNGVLSNTVPVLSLYGDNSTAVNNMSVTGNLAVNSVNITPSSGDITKEQSFSAANNQSSPADVTGLLFSPSNVRSFFAYVSVVINADASKYAQYELRGLQKDAGTWILSSQYIGDNTGVAFSITSSGQVQYTSTNIAGFVSGIMKFRGFVTST